ncbi:MAG TPA: MogA/MoaB family molybdenum cofactor biosynthesis protein [Candidatus Sulfotelmatobacter sp.]
MGTKKRKKTSSSTAKVSPQRTLTAAVVTVSDSCARGERQDASGPAVAELLSASGFLISAREIVPDDSTQIQTVLINLAKQARLIVTTGGTGIAERDITPEATETICDRLVPGIAEKMRGEGSKKTPFAALSRGICGVFANSLILNLPGSPRGAVESLRAVLEILPHALSLLEGKTEHS